MSNIALYMIKGNHMKRDDSNIFRNISIGENCWLQVRNVPLGYSVSVYDADADATLPTVHIFSSLDRAIVYARQGYKGELV